MSSNVSSYALEKTESLFRTKIEETGDWVVWNVRRFRVEETLGQPYSGVVEVVTRNLETKVISLAGADCVLEIDRGSERIRRFGGIVIKITNIGDQQEKDLAQIHFAPALSTLDFGTNSRSFEEMTTAQIVEVVLKEGLKEFYRPFIALFSCVDCISTMLNPIYYVGLIDCSHSFRNSVYKSIHGSRRVSSNQSFQLCPS